MRDVFVADLAGIGGEVAQAVAEGAVKEFAARVGHDCEGGTSYQCAFLLDLLPEKLERASFHTRLSMALGAALMERDDDHHPACV